MILDAVGRYSNIFKQEGEQIKSMSHFFISPFFTIFFWPPAFKDMDRIFTFPRFRILVDFPSFRRSTIPPLLHLRSPLNTLSYALISGRGNTEKVFYCLRNIYKYSDLKLELRCWITIN